MTPRTTLVACPADLIGSCDTTRVRERESVMRHRPGFERRLAAVILRHDLGRGVVCAVLMVALVLLSLPIWLALALPFLIYGGLWLIASSGVVPELEAPHQRRAPSIRHEMYDLCLARQAELIAL